MNPMLIVTSLALSLASVMSFVAWTVVRDNRRRSELRIAGLAADIHGLNAGPGRDLPLRDRPVATPFASPESPARRPVAVAIGAGALVVSVVAAMLMLATNGARPAASDQAATPAAPATAPALDLPQPLDLIALSHEREADRLTVRGIVRNPGRAAAVRHLTAVVLLFNREGGFLTSGRAQVNTGELAPGSDASFVIGVPAAAEVGRYRVSFRSDDRVVPHIDRRGK